MDCVTSVCVACMALSPLALQAQSGQRQLSKQDAHLTDLTLHTVAQLLQAPEAAQTAIRSGLPALLNQFAQCPHFTSPQTASLEAAKVQGLSLPGPLVTCIHYMNEAQGGTEQLLEHLQASSMTAILGLIFDWLESPGFAHKPNIGADETSMGAFDAASMLLSLGMPAPHAAASLPPMISLLADKLILILYMLWLSTYAEHLLGDSLHVPFV